MKLVKSYMKRKVVHFKPQDSIFNVAKILSKYHISGAPVVSNGKVVGVISETDIIKYMRLKLPEENALTHEFHILSILLISLVKDHLEFKKELQKMSKIKVKDLMSKEVVSISPDGNIIEAATVMEKNRVDRLPVIHNGRLVGIIARPDLLRALVE
ncbi:MAG: CBS domain-containing protein [Candidatus Aenigmarchaeota archaeon]|nr:CBS domain-containing protein [Candidatus Aenigmarchaeota archaeon]